MKKLLSMTAIMLVLSSCGAGNIRSYSLNAAAQKNPIIEAKFVNKGGRGPITATMKNGETFTGEFTTQDIGGSSFGTIFGQAHGKAYGSGGGTVSGSMSSSGISTGMWSANSMPGVATLQGSKGTVLSCEYFVNWTGQGAGGCKSTSGGLYRIHFD